MALVDQAAMLAPGIISMASGIWLTLQLKGTPREEGLPSVGAWRNDPLELRQKRSTLPMVMKKSSDQSQSYSVAIPTIFGRFR